MAFCRMTANQPDPNELEAVRLIAIDPDAGVIVSFEVSVANADMPRMRHVAPSLKPCFGNAISEVGLMSAFVSTKIKGDRAV